MFSVKPTNLHIIQVYPTITDASDEEFDNVYYKVLKYNQNTSKRHTYNIIKTYFNCKNVYRTENNHLNNIIKKYSLA